MFNFLLLLMFLRIFLNKKKVNDNFLKKKEKQEIRNVSIKMCRKKGKCI
jgi:hypothetical protein